MRDAGRFLTMSMDASHEASILVALSAAGIAATANPGLAMRSENGPGYSAITLANAADYERASAVIARLKWTPTLSPKASRVPLIVLLVVMAAAIITGILHG